MGPDRLPVNQSISPNEKVKYSPRAGDPVTGELDRSPLRELSALGQSVWVNGLSRDALRSGKLKRLIDGDGVSGASSNFDAMDEAIRKSDAYDHVILSGRRDGASAEDLYLTLAIEDAQAAADLLRPVYEGTDGRDGFVSLDISPYLAHDIPGTVEEARMLWGRLARPNVLIRIPSTVAGIAAIRTLVEEGVNVNATLVFGRFRYGHAANAYVSGLLNRVARGLPVARIASVVSFGLPGLDCVLDRRLDALATQGNTNAAALIGKLATAEARLTYARYRELFDCNGFFAELANQCAWPQTLVWSSTAAGGAYPAARYIDPLIGPGAFVELPPETIDFYRERGQPDLRITEQCTEAELAMAKLATLGLDVCDAEIVLEAKELENRRAAYDRLLESLSKQVGGRRGLLASTTTSSEPRSDSK